MDLLVTLLIAAVIGYVAYLIAGAVPFLKPYQNIVGLVVFLLVLLGGTGF